MSFSQNHTEINSDDWTITKKTTRTIKHEHFSKMKILKVDRRALSLILDDKKLNTTDLWRSCATMSCFPIIRYNRIHIATRTSDRRRKCRPHKRIVTYEETCEYCTNAPANVHCWNDNTTILDTDISFSNDRDGNLTTVVNTGEYSGQVGSEQSHLMETTDQWPLTGHASPVSPSKCLEWKDPSSVFQLLSPGKVP